VSLFTLHDRVGIFDHHFATDDLLGRRNSENIV